MKNSARNLLIACMAVYGLGACKKEKNTTVPITISLETPVQNGQLVTLTWTAVTSDSLVSYTIYKSPDTTVAPPVQIAVSKGTNTYTDTLPLTPYVKYYVVANLKARETQSNAQVWSRTDMTFMNLTAVDALLDSAGQLLYVYDLKGNMAVYDLQHNKADTQINLQSNTGYCGLGTYNGTKELYVPREDGYIYIYNAVTLALIDQFHVGGGLVNVVYSNGLLYTSAQVGGYFYLFAYNRATKAQVSQVVTNEGVHIRQVAGTTTNFYAMSEANELYFFRYDAGGNLQYVKDTTIFASVAADQVVMFPGAAALLLTGDGVIYTDSLQQSGSLPSGATYVDYCFDAANSLVYAGTTNNVIQAYNTTTFSLTKTIATQGTPVKLFFYNGHVLSVSTATFRPSYYSTESQTFTFTEVF